MGIIGGILIALGVVVAGYAFYAGIGQPVVDEKLRYVFFAGAGAAGLGVVLAVVSLFV